MGDISAGVPVNEEDLVNVCCLPDATSSTGYFYTTLQSELSSMKQDKSLLLLTAKTKGQKPLSEYFTLYSDKSAQVMFYILISIMQVGSSAHSVGMHFLAYMIVQPSIITSLLRIFTINPLMNSRRCEGENIHAKDVNIHSDDKNNHRV